MFAFGDLLETLIIIYIVNGGNKWYNVFPFYTTFKSEGYSDKIKCWNDPDWAANKFPKIVIFIY